MNTLLSDSQQTTWTAIQSGWGQSMPLRMLSLTDQQRIDLSRAQRHYRYRHAAASTDEERSTAVTTRESDLSQILTVDQQAVLSAYDGYYGNASQAVATAFETVLSADEG